MRLKSLTIFMLVLLVSGCTQYKSIQAPSQVVTEPEIKVDEKIFYVAHLPALEGVLESTSIEVKEAPENWYFSGCGGVYRDEALIKELLKEAKVIFRFNGVKEEWVPIEGKPNEYFVFTMQ